MTKNRQSGFSYIEVMIAIVILSVGVLALLAGITGAAVRSKGQDRQIYARQIAASTMESIMSVKETDPARLGWPAVGNVGSNLDVNGNPQGIFVNGVQSVKPDAGPDEVIGTADDTGADVPGFSREIVITDVCDPDRPSPNCPTPGGFAVRVRTVRVTVTYQIGGLLNQERVQTVLTDYSLPN